MTEFRNRNVLITGAAHGLGKRLAEKIGKEGGRLILCDVNAEGLERTARRLEDNGITVYQRPFDVSDRESVYNAARDIISEAGQVDILINNAGVVYTGEILDLPDELIDRHVNINLMGSIWMIKAFVPAMVERGDGHIVNIASSAGLLAMPGMGIYSATKFAVVGFTDALRMELKNRHSRVKTTTVCPYIIKTGMFEGMKTPFFQPPLTTEDMAEAVVDGIRRDSKMVLKPWTAYLPPMIKALFPPQVMDSVLTVSGLDKAIYHCKGFNLRRDTGHQSQGTSPLRQTGHVE